MACLDPLDDGNRFFRLAVLDKFIRLRDQGLDRSGDQVQLCWRKLGRPLGDQMGRGDQQGQHQNRQSRA